MAAASTRNAVRNLMHRVTSHGICPCHSCQAASSSLDVLSARQAIRTKGAARSKTRAYATPVEQGDYAFEVSASNLRFGEGVTKEVGMDFKNMNATKVGVFTDSTIAKLLPMKTAVQSLTDNDVKYEIFDRCRVEPTQESWQDAINWAKQKNISHFLAVGGGSVIDVRLFPSPESISVVGLVWISS